MNILNNSNDICDFCPLDKKGAFYTPNSSSAGCEGSHCNEANEAYQEYQINKLFNCCYITLT